MYNAESMSRVCAEKMQQVSPVHGLEMLNSEPGSDQR